MNRVAFIFILFLGGCAPRLSTIEKPILFDEERKLLSLEYMRDRHGMVQSEPTIKPQMIVLHWTAINSLEGSFRAFDPVRIPGSRQNLASVNAVNVSVPYLIDRDGTIYKLMPDNYFGRHVIGLNHCAIGVENVGGSKEPLTPEQIKANIKLVKYLKKKYPAIEYLIGHHEYTRFENHPLWKESDTNYRTIKTDPGDEFMEAVRSGVKKLDLKGAP